MTYDISAVLKAYPDARSCDETLGPRDKDGNFFTPEKAKVDAARVELNKLKYKDQREIQYPSLQEQLDLQYWDKKNGTNKWVEAIDKVKSDNPKS